MKSIVEAVRKDGLLISDGAWGTMLMAAGLKTGDCSEIWNIERPEVLRDIGRQYIEAGAQLITTNSFQGSRFTLEQHGCQDRVRELNRAAAALSREAAGSSHFVVGSMGPTGKFLLTGEVSEQELYDAFAEQAAALAEGGADACCIETMSAADEAAIAVRAAKENTPLEVICTFTFQRQAEGAYFTMMGVTPAQAAMAVVEAGADFIGSNCSQGPAQMVEIVREMHAAAPALPIVVHPNAGLPVASDDGEIYLETPESMAAHVPAFVAAGARILGGCCGTTPAHIRAIAAAVAEARRKLA